MELSYYLLLIFFMVLCTVLVYLLLKKNENNASINHNCNHKHSKKKKRKKENGVDVFEVDSNILRSARISNRKRDKFIKAMGNTKLARELKQYFKTYPSAPLLLQDESGVMVRLRR